jgi:NAD(P)-dependent dehydrogenase (short-subunit alcohol dehydrogenase family)
MGFKLVEFTRGVEDMRNLDDSMPFGHVCKPEEIASAVAFLVGPDGSYVTNQRITVSGGGF